MISQKRPFGVNLEGKKQRLTRIICDYAKKNSTIGEEVSQDHWGYDRKWVRFECPFCKKKTDYDTGKYSFINEDFSGELTDDGLYYIGYNQITMHIKNQVRLNGCKDHMEAILEIFGQKDGMEILDIFAKKNLIVAKLICEFINSKLITNDALQKGDEQ